jgi:hypothetical protein
MTKVYLDSALRKKLHDLTQHLELCDESGRVLARLVPVLDPSKYILEPQISHEELQRRKQANEKTYTTAEVLAYLETL